MPMAPPGPGSRVSLGDLYSTCVQLNNENKISTKNAFDVHLIDHMDEIVNTFMVPSDAGQGRKSQADKAASEAENRFHEASCTIEVSARIYACRVDVVHTDTYRVLGGLSAADMGEDDEKDGEGADGRAAKRRRIVGVNTLEKNEASIIQHTIEADETSDPTFRRMAAAFDAGGAKGLLLAHLPIDEDLSLVFNGDVPLKRARQNSREIFANRLELTASQLGMDLPNFKSRLVGANLCPEIEQFRKYLWGADSAKDFSLPESLEAIVGVGPGGSARSAPKGMPLMDATQGNGMTGGVDTFGDDGAMGFDSMEPLPGDLGQVDATLGPVDGSDLGAPLVPISDEACANDALAVPPGKEDVIAFDALFEKFCSRGSSHPFAYFDECWARRREKDDKAGPAAGAAEAPEAGGEGVLVAPLEGADAAEKTKRERRPLFDISGLDKPAKPIETEPVHKHQLSEKAAHWQRHKDVPPYMIDRITMPSWPTWSKCDFACLGLRPHLMLKLVRRQQPAGEGPHSFSDLFSTVVVENPEAYPWLSTPGAAGRTSTGPFGEDGGLDEARARADGDFGDEADEDFDGTGLPAHLDVDPSDLFLREGDRVVPGGDQDDAECAFDDGLGGDNGFQPQVDFELAEKPQGVGDTSIQYSRNSKFVNVKLVKKHLWDVISEGIADAKAARMTGTNSVSFQGLVSKVVARMPKGELENLTVQVCFICALHLCNEKGLELVTDPDKPLGDFQVAAEL